MKRLSLLSKIWLSTSVALTLLFGITGLILQRYALETAGVSLRDEVRASVQAYESLWQTRSEALGSVAAVISSMPNVRSAFQTRHRATIRDVAGELWIRISDELKETAFFVVADPEGDTVASLDTSSPVNIPARWPMVRTARSRFPKQASGFSVIDGSLYQLVLTPVYVDASQGSSLISVLVTGYVVDHSVAQRLKQATGGSEFLFAAPGRVFASTLNKRATEVLLERLEHRSDLISDGVSEYYPVRRDLIDIEGRPVGVIAVFRSFDTAAERMAALRRQLINIWLCAVGAGLAVSYLLARRIVHPVKMLDRAAAEVSRQNYDLHVPVKGDDELSRLAETFNMMCSSLQSARQELIRQERISTIGRMASSIVHDLRNPLAAIYGGAEMMVDTELSPPQVKRLAANIYRSSRRIQEMLQDLLQVTRGKSGDREVCSLDEVIRAAVEELQPTLIAQNVHLSLNGRAGIELPMERSRIERVFLNLIANALDVLPEGGSIGISIREYDDSVEVDVRDSGPGIAPEVRSQLFQPFATHGKRGGLGLGLALSRQTLLDHGGDLTAADRPGPGATFTVRLPKTTVSQPASLQTA
jgi:signal transduction histidine kinase